MSDERPHIDEHQRPITHDRHDHGHPVHNPTQPDYGRGSGGNERHDTPGNPHGPHHPLPDGLDDL